jgi:integrase
MPRARLTELSVARLKPPVRGRLELWDATLPSFGLRVSAKGAKSWVVMTRVHGKLKRFTLGKYPLMDLGDARNAARAALQKAARGEDPVGEEPAPTTVEEVVEDFIKRYIEPNRRKRSGREAAAQLRREFVELHGHLPIGTIGRRHVLQALDRVTDRGATIAANRLLANLSRLFGWALERGIIDATPIANIKAPAKERSRDRVLGDDELALAWHCCGTLDWPFGPIFRLLMVTLQRRNEVAYMGWSDVDLDRKLWILPRELTKADRAHEVPLSLLAVQIIQELPLLKGEEGDDQRKRKTSLMFPSRRARSVEPVSGFSRAKRRLDAEMLKRLRKQAEERREDPGKVELAPWRLHDLRRTGASGMARLGHPPHVVTAILNHSPGATMGITAVYNRHRYADEKRAALDAWSREIERIIGRNDAEVISLLGQGHK